MRFRLCSQDVEAGEELVYSYGYDISRLKDGERRELCKCGAKNCKGVLR